MGQWSFAACQDLYYVLPLVHGCGELYSFFGGGDLLDDGSCGMDMASLGLLGIRFEMSWGMAMDDCSHAFGGTRVVKRAADCVFRFCCFPVPESWCPGRG